MYTYNDRILSVVVIHRPDLLAKPLVDYLKSFRGFVVDGETMIWKNNTFCRELMMRDLFMAIKYLPAGTSDCRVWTAKIFMPKSEVKDLRDVDVAVSHFKSFINPAISDLKFGEEELMGPCGGKQMVPYAEFSRARVPYSLSFLALTLESSKLYNAIYNSATSNELVDKMLTMSISSVPAFHMLLLALYVSSVFRDSFPITEYSGPVNAVMNMVSEETWMAFFQKLTDGQLSLLWETCPKARAQIALFRHYQKGS